MHIVWKLPKMSHLNFWILAFPPIFDKSDQSSNTVWPQALGLVFNELLSTQNVQVARFASNVECDFLGDFQTMCQMSLCKVSLYAILSKVNS